jgi:hypothetical protein
MQQVNTNLKYPTRYEIEQTLTADFCSRSFVDKFAQSRGVFITKAIQDELSEHLSGFFYEHFDIEEIRDNAYKRNSSKTLAGFVVTSQDEEFDPVQALDGLRGSIELEKGVVLGPIVEETNSDGSKQFKGSMEYVDRKPGRIEFLQEEVRQFDYTIKSIDDNSYQILVECQKSNDANVFEKLVKKKTGKDVRSETLDPEILSAKNTITFFDELAMKGMPGDWRLVEVRQLIFRKSKSESEEEVNTEELSGITQAILDGNNLRENKFVKQSEESGYRFTAMTYEFEHKTHPQIIQIRAEFKSRPKVFEVGIHDFKLREGLEEKTTKADMNDREEITLKTYIWQRSKEIYKDIISKIE